MEFKEAIGKLQKSKEFKDWKKNSPNSVLTYAFLMISPDVEKEWQVGYFNPKQETISTFTISEKIHRNPDSEMLKAGSIRELDVPKVKVEFDKALDTARRLQQKEYPEHKAEKKMMILQKLGIGQVWNLTYITKTFKTLNIKIDSSSGEILKHELLELFTFSK
ncbi:TPA: hypothetical protein HA239_03855 [Candidatus Woesearchaeota archaeon]|nr:hypothetical protein QT06_C0001G0811 [archaeon GW2011_AR15]MBS3103409.1 hypothetical protein [Candidatus Woesearchaeota archaeon]HIH41526.1 hypothetical protein [Candidatus Woesearchaeota archaeon]